MTQTDKAMHSNDTLLAKLLLPLVIEAKLVETGKFFAVPILLLVTDLVLSPGWASPFLRRPKANTIYEYWGIAFTRTE
jgi:hypothetical protein